MHRHRVKRHMWNHVDGRMATEERYFLSLEAAIKFLKEVEFDKFKIYDQNETLVHSGSKENFESYA